MRRILLPRSARTRRAVSAVVVAGALVTALLPQPPRTPGVESPNALAAATAAPNAYVTVDSSSPARAGGSASWRVSVHNAGDLATAGTVTVALTTSGGAAGEVTATGSGWTCASQTCTSDAVIAGSGIAPVITATVPVTASVLDYPSITLSARVTAAGDTSPGDDNASSQLPVVQGAGSDLAVAVSNAGVAKAGDVASFAVVVANAGGAAAPGPIRVSLRTGGSTTSAALRSSGSGWTCPGAADECTSATTVAAGATLPTLTVRVPVSTDLVYAGTASLTATITNASDGLPANDTGTATTGISRRGSGDLALAAAPSGPAIAGGQAAFKVVVSNAGGASAAGPVRVRLASSGAVASSTLTGSGSGWSCPGDGSECTAAASSVAAGAALPALTVKAQAAPDASTAGTVALSASLVSRTEDISSNDTAYATAPVVAASTGDLAVGIAPSGLASAGGTGSFAVVVRNVGGASVAGPVRLALNAGGPLRSSAISGAGNGWTCPGDGRECTWTGTVVAGATLPTLTAALSVQDDPAAPSSISLSAAISSANAGPAGNDSVSASESVRGSGIVSDLQPAIGTVTPALPGSSVQTPVVVTNSGSATVAGRTTVRISSSLAGATAAGSNWSCSSNLQCDTTTAVAAGATLPALTVTAPVRGDANPDSPTISATVTNKADSSNRNDSTSAQVGIGGGAVDLAPDVTGPAPGTQGWTVHVRDSGSSTSAGRITAELGAPARSTASGSGWVCSSRLVCTTSAAVAPGQALPDLAVTTPTPSVNDTTGYSLNVTISGGGDTNARNNSSSASSSVGMPPVDLTVTTAMSAPAQPGSVVTGTAVVTNTGTGTDAGPVELDLSSSLAKAVAAGTGWTCSLGLVCSYDGSVAAGATLPAVTVTAPAPAADSIASVGLWAVVSSAADGISRNDYSSASGAIGGAPADAVVVLDGDTAVTSAHPTRVLVHVSSVGTGPVPGQVSVQVTAPFPNATASGDGWQCDPQLACTHDGPVAGGSSLPDIAVDVRAPAGTASTTGGVSATVSVPTESLTRNDQANLVLPVVRTSGPAALTTSVTRVGGNAPVGNGDTVQFGVTVDNASSGTVGAPTVTLTPSFGLVVQGAAGIGWTCSGRACTYVGPLSSGETLHLDVTAIESDAAVSRSFLSASSAWTTPTPGRDTATAAVLVAGRGVDLAPVVISGDSAVSGTSARFRVGVRNVGGDDASTPTTVTLDVFGASYGAVSASGTGWSCPAHASRCTAAGPATAGRSLPDLIVDVPVADDRFSYGSTVGLRATVANSLDVNGSDDQASASTAVIGASRADLGLTVRATGRATAGGTAGFDVVARNLGGGSRPGPVRIALTARGNTIAGTLTGTGPGWQCPGRGDECSHTGDLAAGTTLPTLHVAAKVSPDFQNGYNAQLDAHLVGAVDNNSGNDSGSALTPIVAASGGDLALAVSGNGTAPVGGNARFTVVARNVGTSTVSAPIEVHLSTGGATDGPIVAGGTSWTCVGTTGDCVLGTDLAPGATAPDLTVANQVSADLASSSNVYLNASLTTVDGTSGDDSASAGVPVVASSNTDLALAVTSSGVAAAGGYAEFRVSLANLGGTVASGPTRVAVRPQGAAVGAGDLRVTGSGWTCPGDATECTYTPALNAHSGAATLVLGVPVAAGDADSGGRSVGLSASVSNPSDDLRGNESGYAETPVATTRSGPDLAVVAGAPTPRAEGASASFTIVAANTGNTDSAGPATVHISAPTSGAVATGTGWTCDPQLNCSREAGIGAGAAAGPITVTTNLPTADFFSTAGISASVEAQDDTDNTNNYSAATSAVGGADRDLTVVVSGGTPVRTGSSASWSTVVRNTGTVASTGAITVDLSAPLPGATASGDGWDCSTTLQCTTTRTIAAGGAADPITVVQPTPTADVATGLGLTATVHADDDTLTRNNTSWATASVGGVPVDVTVDLGAGEPATPGGALTYVAHVRNNGGVDSQGLVTVTLSAPFGGANAAGDGWACSTQLQCDYVGDAQLAAGGALPDLVLTVPVPARADAAQASASVTGGGDAFTRNNYAVSTSTSGGTPTDLIVQLAGEKPFVAGASSEFRARVKNLGTDADQSVVTVQLSAPYSATAAGDGWDCSSQLVCDHAGPVSAGATLPDLVLTVPVPPSAQPGTTGVSASVTGDDDSNPSNNQDSLTLPVVQLLGGAGVGSAYVTAQADALGTYPGGRLPVTLQLNGAAPVNDQPAQLALTLPAGVRYVPGSSAGLDEPSGPVAAPTWSFTMPPVGQVRELRIVLALDASVDAGTPKLQATLTGTQDVSETVSAALRVVAPTITQVTPAAVGQAKSVSVSFNGDQLSPGFGYALVHGSSVLTATDAHGAAGNVVATFDTSATALGSYDARVTVPGGATLTSANAVTVARTSADDFGVQVVGPSRVRLNSPGRYYATVTNSGNVDAYDVPVVVTVPAGLDASVVSPESKAVEQAAVDSITADNPGTGQISPALAAQLKDYIAASTTAATPDPSKPQSYVMTYVPHLAPGASSTSTVEVVPRKLVTGNVTASVPVDTGYYTSTQHVANFDRRITLAAAGKTTTIADSVNEICGDPALADACPTIRGYTNGLGQASKVAHDYACVSFTGVTLGLVNANCSLNNPLSIPSPSDIVKQIVLRKFPSLHPLDKAYGVFSFVKGLFDDLFGAADAIEGGYKNAQFGVASTDPNEMDGPVGTGSRRFVSADTTFEYTIKFENVKTATAAAQRVTVSDQLPAAIDPASVRVVGAEIGGEQIPIEANSGDAGLSYTGSTELSTHRTVLVDAAVDAGSRTLTAHFAGPSALDDPFNPSPYSDFLPPNVTAPEGEGSLRITATLAAGTADGTVVDNAAAITFDDHAGGPTIRTNTWSNTIDRTPPTASLAALPAQVGTSAHLTWTTDDGAGSGAGGARILVGTDGAPPTISNVFVPGQSYDLPVTAGHRYSVAITPIDAAGNVGPTTSPVTTSTIVRATTLTASAPATVAYNGTPTLTGHLTDSTSHADVSGQPVQLYRRATASAPWTLVSTVSTTSAGVVVAKPRSTANGQYQWRFAGAAGYSASTSPVLTVTTTQVVSAQRTPASVKRGQSIKVYGTLASGGTGSKVYLQRLVGRTWKTVSGAVVVKKQTMPDHKSRIGFLVTTKLSAAGKYTFRVLAPATSTLGAGTSAALTATAK